ncbi:MAG: DUF2141 domain-containing protein [Bryobacteraceae bacterium]|nr:DUF2141 domain-containing protein [Bryobacteraceae bacterium]MDW8380357.1 DUF2141 domain-containing protein [Bryobacterales bacterium]
MKRLSLFFGLLLLSSAETAGKGTIQVHIKGLRNNSGQVILLLFEQPKGFPGDPYQAVAMQRAEMEGDRARATFHGIPFGSYAISVLHDENSNAKMDTTRIGLPKEGWGASRNPKPRFRAPRFEEAKFAFSASELLVEIDMLYLR